MRNPEDPQRPFSFPTWAWRWLHSMTVPTGERGEPAWGCWRCQIGAVGKVIFEVLLIFLGVAVLFAAFVNPILVAILAIPGTLLLGRVGGSFLTATGSHSSSISTSDVLTFLGALVCLPFLDWSSQHLRRMMSGIFVYMLVLVFIVAGHPDHYDLLEWVHRLTILGGSVIIGWTVVYRGKGRTACRALLWAIGALALFAILNGAAHGFAPAQSGVYQKNPVGVFMWIGIVLAQVNPPWADLGKRQRQLFSLLFLGGLLASQSRQAMVALVVAFTVVVLLQPRLLKGVKTAVVAVVAVGGVAYESLKAELAQNSQFSTINIRNRQNSYGMAIWHQFPVFGAGLRYYYEPAFTGNPPPPSVIVDALATSGVIGLIALIYLVLATVRASWKVPRSVGVLGVAVLVAHYVSGLFDVFWIGANGALPFMLAGMAVGAGDLLARQEKESADERVLSQPLAQRELPGGDFPPGWTGPRGSPPSNLLPSVPWRAGRPPGETGSPGG